MHLLRTAFLLIGFAGSLAWAADKPEPPRIKRQDAFFGLHFDFHARDTDTDIGKNTTREMIEKVIDAVKPDYLQIDCKGHKGYVSYPSKLGNTPPAGITGDPLKLWRQVTAERGVSLIMHYSGVIDARATQEHPDWCVMGPSGKVSGRSTSLFSPYAEQLFIPQMKELALNYGVDGIWIDGDNWGVNVDYSPAAIAAFKKATGITTVPQSEKDPHWFEFLEFHRETYRKFLRNYIAEVKKVAPNFIIAVNSTFGDYMPEAITAPVDFLSMDVIPHSAQVKTRVTTRYFAGQGVPWDLMSWGFSSSKEDKTKRVQRPVLDLEREAAKAIAWGGGYEIYLKQERDGSIKEDMTGIAEIAKFCRARQPFCHRAQQVPQVAVLLSTPAYYRQINRPFKDKPDVFLETLKTMIFAKYSTELLSEHRLVGRMKDYPLIVIPNWEYIEPSFKEQLMTYVNEGGQLLLVGPKIARIFQKELDVTVEEDTTAPAAGQPARPVDPSKDGPLKITRGPKAEAIDIPVKASNPVIFTDPAASSINIGKGRIAVVYSSKPVGPLLSGVAQKLFPEPIAQIKGGSMEVVINRKDGKLAVNMVNNRDVAEGPLEVTIRQQPQPKKVMLQPSNLELPFKYEGGNILVTVPKIDIHEVIVVE